MPLTDVTIVPVDGELPSRVVEFLGEADRRIEEFQRHGQTPGFVASDFPRVYQYLLALRSSNHLAGDLFCEWGSGFGVVACLAAMIGFDAVGVEIDSDLVDAARTLADDFEVPVEFVHGSFIPRGGTAFTGGCGRLAWLNIVESANLPYGADDFDVIFAYPWPEEAGVTEKLFERYAADRALLMTHHADGEVRIRRKPRRRRKGSKS